MLRGIRHEAEAIRKQPEALYALEEAQGAPQHAMTTTAPASQQDPGTWSSRAWPVEPTGVLGPPDVVPRCTRAPDVLPLTFEDGVWARRAKHATHGIEPVAK